MCSRLTVKSKSSGDTNTHTRTRTHAHIRIHANTQTPRARPLSLTVRRGVHELAPARSGSAAYTRTVTESGAVDILPVPTGGGRSGVRALTRTRTHTRTRRTHTRARDRARARWQRRRRRRHCILGRAYACVRSGP